MPSRTRARARSSVWPRLLQPHLGLGGAAPRRAQLGLGQFEVAPQRRVVEPREHLARLHRHPFFDEHLDDLARHLRRHRGAPARRHVARRVQHGGAAARPRERSVSTTAATRTGTARGARSQYHSAAPATPRDARAPAATRPDAAGAAVARVVVNPQIAQRGFRIAHRVESFMLPRPRPSAQRHVFRVGRRAGHGPVPSPAPTPADTGGAGRRRGRRTRGRGISACSRSSLQPAQLVAVEIAQVAEDERRARARQRPDRREPAVAPESRADTGIPCGDSLRSIHFQSCQLRGAGQRDFEMISY